MTVTAQLDTKHPQIEYILCIEGFGWPDDTESPTAFVGDIWSTADLNSDLASLTGATVHTGLAIDGEYAETLDPITMQYSVADLGFSLVDYDGFLVANFAPKATPTTDTVNTAIDYRDNDIILDTGTFSTGDTVWLGGIECIKLGTKSGGGAPHTYTGCTRGYLGTNRGPVNWMRLHNDRMRWNVGDVANSVTGIYRNRMIRLYMHVPGEAASEVYFLWQGKLNNASVPTAGNTWNLTCTADMLPKISRFRNAPVLRVVSNKFAGNSNSGTQTIDGGQNNDAVLAGVQSNADDYHRRIELQSMTDADDTSKNHWAAKNVIVRALYRYRTEDNGSADLFAAGGPDPLDTATYNDYSGSLINIGGRYLRLLRRADANLPLRHFRSSVNSFSDVTGDWFFELFRDGAEARWLLDTFQEDWQFDRFSVDQHHKRHPIELALFFLTSHPGEFETNIQQGASATGSTTVVTLASALTGDAATADFYKGYSLYKTNSGTAANIHFAREIVASTSAAITTTPFPAGHANTDRFHIRASAYDQLPVSFGAAIHPSKIDISSFLRIRDRHMAHYEVPPVAIGGEDKWDIITFVQEMLLKPINCYMYLDRDTGLIKCDYTGIPKGEDIDVDYVSIAKSNIVNIGSLNYNIGKVLGRVSLTVRGVNTVQARLPTVVRSATNGYRRRHISLAGMDFGVDAGFSQSSGVTPGDASEQSIHITADEKQINQSYFPEGTENIEINAQLWNAKFYPGLVEQAKIKLQNYQIPPPILSMDLDISLFTSLRVNDFIKVSWADVPVNPYQTTRGLSNTIGRITELSWDMISPHFRIVAELHGQDTNGSLIAPAAFTQTAYTDDSPSVNMTKIPTAGTQFVSEYIFNVGANGAGDKNFWHFAVGDRVQIRSAIGVSKATGVIVSFGDNEAATPKAASTDSINVASGGAALGIAFAAGDYITLDAWTTGQPARMDSYAGIADTTTELLDAADAAKEYT